MKTVKINLIALFSALFISTITLKAQDTPDQKTTAAGVVSLAVDPAASSLTWTAKKFGGQHNGTVKLTKGTVTLNNLELTGGQFEIDLTTITNADLTQPAVNKKLTDHLKSEDFFAVEIYPTSTFTITQVTPFTTAQPGGPNYTITGDLMIKGITNPITFPATVLLSNESATASARIEVNRLRYDIKYRSRVLGTVPDMIIHDEFTMEIKLVAGKANTAKL